MKTKKKKEFGYFEAFIVALCIVGIGYTIWFFANMWYHTGKRRAISGLEEPKQTDVTGGFDLIRGDYSCKVTLKCSYDIDALVVHTKEYSGSGLDDALAPVDLGLAWGKVAELNDTIDFHWDQRNRRCIASDLYDADMALLGGRENLVKGFSNNHIIPAEKVVEKEVRKIRAGDRVRLRGYLVYIEGTKMSTGQVANYNSSTTREDEGDGACEVFYVTNVDIIDAA